MGGIQTGDPAPDFELEGTDGVHRLADHRGEWVIVAFYPGDFTPVCTRQFCSYRDGADRLEELDATMFGISPQSLPSHERFKREYDLTVPLLADPDRVAVRAYGVLGPGGLVRRSVFIVDPQGIVRYRHRALLGIHYKDVEALASILDRVRGAAA
jgi:thioredoxin-dependent peroxiredoxin